MRKVRGGLQSSEVVAVRLLGAERVVPLRLEPEGDDAVEAVLPPVSVRALSHVLQQVCQVLTWQRRCQREALLHKEEWGSWPHVTNKVVPAAAAAAAAHRTAIEALLPLLAPLAEAERDGLLADQSGPVAKALVSQRAVADEGRGALPMSLLLCQDGVELDSAPHRRVLWIGYARGLSAPDSRVLEMLLAHGAESRLLDLRFI